MDFTMSLSHTESKVLVTLATYKYLTNSQMRKLGVTTDRANLNTVLRCMRKQKKLINSIIYGTTPTQGRHQSLHYLTQTGKKALLTQYLWEDENTIKIPVNSSAVPIKDYWHRIYTIDCHIVIQQWAEQEGIYLDSFDTYFDKIGNNRRDSNLRQKTRTDIDKNHFLVSDAVFLLDVEGVHKLFCLEVYNDDRYVPRIIRSIKQYVRVLANGSSVGQYNIQKAPAILNVFTHEHIMRKALEALKSQKYFTYTKDFFFFKTLQSINDPQQDVSQGWLNLNEKEVSMI